MIHWFFDCGLTALAHVSVKSVPFAAFCFYLFLDVVVTCAVRMCWLTCLRPPDDSRTDLYILPLSFIYFYRPFLKTNPGQKWAAATRQKYIRGVVLGWTWLIHSDIMPIPPPKVLGVEKCEIWLSFSTPVVFDALWFQNGGTCWKSNTFTLSNDDWALFSFVHFAHLFANFYRESNICKFGPLGAVVSKQSNLSKIWNPRWKHQW